MARILLLTHIFPPAIDGGSKVIFKVGEWFSKTGHRVIALTTNAYSTDDFTRRYKKIHTDYCLPFTVYYLPVYTIFHRPIKFLIKLFSKIPFLSHDSYFITQFSVFSKGPIFKLIPFIAALISIFRFRPDYIIAGPLPTTIIVYARFLKIITKSKLLLNASFHPSDPEFSQKLLIDSLKSADFIWTLTDHETDYLNQHFDIPKSKMLKVGNGIDSSLLIQKPKFSKSNNLLYVGSFAAHKGIETLITAFTKLNFQFKNKFHLTLAGQPTLHFPKIEKLINSLPPDVQSRIQIIKRFSDNDLPKLIDQSIILVSPSTQESFGLVLLEAMARGRPVVAADIPASSELVHQSKAGLLFKTGDPNDLCEKIKTLLESPKYANYSKNGLEYARKHTWDRICLSLWQKLSS